MKNAKEFIEFIERERAAAEESGLSYTAIVLGELKEKIEAAVTEGDTSSATNAAPVSPAGSVTLEGKQHSVVSNNSSAATLPRGEGFEELPVKIGGEVYSVLMPTIPELDGPAKIKPWRVYGVGVNKDGVAFVVNEFEEIYKLDDEDEGLSFSTREKAEEFLRKVIGNSEE